MRVAIGADHRGSEAAQRVIERIRAAGHEVAPMGDLSGESHDYPDSAFLVGSAVARGEAERGILMCGTGLGMCMAANKVRGVRAALVHDELTAEMSRSHNDANVMCLPADLVGARLIDKIVDVWLKTSFEGGRHARRVKKIDAIERGEDPTAIRE